jgi:hypothetical protein
MLSIEQCKKYLPIDRYTNKEIEEMRDGLYQLVNILIEDHLAKKQAEKT